MAVTSGISCSDVPPTAKKSSSTPIDASSSTARYAASTASSVADRGDVPEPPHSGAGSATTSSLPTGVTGSSSMTITCAGTRWAGNDAAIAERISAPDRSVTA